MQFGISENQTTTVQLTPLANLIFKHHRNLPAVSSLAAAVDNNGELIVLNACPSFLIRKNVNP